MRFLLGLFLILILSPLTVWFAESQHRAKDFSSAEVVDVNQLEDGYIVIEGSTDQNEGIGCPVGGPAGCLYVSTVIRDYVKAEKTVCQASAPDDVRIIRSEPASCDEYDNCEPCWLVEEEEWIETQNTKDFSSFTIGAYTVEPDEGANMIDTQTQVVLNKIDPSNSSDNPVVGDNEITYEYVQLGGQLVVAGNASGGVISGSDKEFVISSSGLEETKTALKTQDKNTALGMRIFSALLMMVGFVLLVSPFMSVTGAFANLIPVIGKAAHGPFKAAVYAIAAAAGFLVWLFVWLSVVFLKNLWWISILGLIILGVVLAKKYLGEKKGRRPQGPTM